jgi:hypothetical protein
VESLPESIVIIAIFFFVIIASMPPVSSLGIILLVDINFLPNNPVPGIIVVMMMLPIRAVVTRGSVDQSRPTIRIPTRSITQARTVEYILQDTHPQVDGSMSPDPA